MHPVSVRKAKNGIDNVVWLGEGFHGQPLPSGFFANCEHIHVSRVAFILVVDARPAPDEVDVRLLPSQRIPALKDAKTVGYPLKPLGVSWTGSTVIDAMDRFLF
jgi:hypothetical protein